MDIVFATDMEVLGELKQHDLKEGGQDIPVTDENKEEYIEYVFPFIDYTYTVLKIRKNETCGGVILINLSSIGYFSWTF